MKFGLMVIWLDFKGCKKRKQMQIRISEAVSGSVGFAFGQSQGEGELDFESYREIWFGHRSCHV